MHPIGRLSRFLEAVVAGGIESRGGATAENTPPPVAVGRLADQSELPPVADGGVQSAAPTAGHRGDGLADTLGVLSVHELLDCIPMPIFALDETHTVVAWNYGAGELYGRSREEVIGSSEYVGRAPDGTPRPTLADEVLDAGGSVPDEYDAQRETIPWLARDAVTGRAWIETADGEARFFRIIVIPVYDGGSDDGLRGVIEFFEDRTESIRRQESTEAAVDEITATLAEIGRGNLSERVALTEAQERHLYEHLKAVIDGINRNAAALETMVDQVHTSTGELVESARETADHAADIADLASDQTGTLHRMASELSEFSATMEEVAANADSVADAAGSAQQAAHDGRSSGRQARDVLSEITAQADEQLAAVSSLDDRMSEVDEIVTIIDDIADQTNLLALNANIEAARTAAGGNSDGFAVVADEVKALAEETKDRTEEIADHVGDIRRQTRDTTEAVGETGQLIEESAEPVDAALSALEEIASAVDEVSTSITEVAVANDEQAATAEEVAAAIDAVQARSDSMEERSAEIRELASRQRTISEDLAEQVDQISGAGNADPDASP